MTDIERKMDHFEKYAPNCRPHKERPVISYDGCHVIECGKGCRLVDGDNAALEPVMLAWDRANR